MKTVIDARPWTMDPKVPEIPWRTDALTLKHLDGGSKLTFGLMRWDEVLMPHPPVLRAIEMTRRALLANGHEGTSVLSATLRALESNTSIQSSTSRRWSTQEEATLSRAFTPAMEAKTSNGP